MKTTPTLKKCKYVNPFRNVPVSSPTEICNFHKTICSTLMQISCRREDFEVQKTTAAVADKQGWGGKTIYF